MSFGISLEEKVVYDLSNDEQKRGDHADVIERPAAPYINLPSVYQGLNNLWHKTPQKKFGECKKHTPQKTKTD